MNSVICKNCGKTYFPHSGHYREHDDCLVSRINFNYPIFTEEGKSQENSYLPSEVHNQSSSTSGKFYSLTNHSSWAPFTHDGSVPFPVYQTNMNTEHGSQVQFHQPSLLSTEHWNVNLGFPLPSQHEGDAIQNMNQSYPFTHEPVSLTSFHNDNPFSLLHVSDNNKVTEMPTDIHMNEILKYPILHEEHNQNEAAETINFSSMSRSQSNNLPHYDPTFADVAQSFPFSPVCSTPIHNDSQISLLHVSNNDKEPEGATNIQTIGMFKSSVLFEKNHNGDYNTGFLSTSQKLCVNPSDYDRPVAGPSHPRHVGHIYPMCGKGFNCQSLLKRHSVVHTKEKQFVCDVCKKSYSQKCNLKRHMLLHKEIKSHKCGQCGKAFTLKHDLKVHMRIHTGEKPFKCQLCDKAFSQLGHLQKHVFIHKRTKSVK